MRLVFTYLAFILFTYSSFSQENKVLDLLGTWKIEGKETYENWEEKDGSVLSGTSYKIINSKKVILENLKIIQLDTSIIYKHRS